MLLDTIEKNAIALRAAGREAIARAKRMGVAVYYEDASLGDGIIRELPDGTLQRVRIEGEHEILLETVGEKR